MVVAHHPVGSNPTLTATARTRWKRYSCVESRVTIDRDEGGVRFSTGSCVNTTGPIGWKRKPIPRVCTRRTASSSTRPSTPILLTPSGRFFFLSRFPLFPLFSLTPVSGFSRFRVFQFYKSFLRIFSPSPSRKVSSYKPFRTFIPLVRVGNRAEKRRF